MSNTPSNLIGKKIRFRTTNSDGSVITFLLPIVAESTLTKTGEPVLKVRVSSKVRALPFPPFGDKPFAWVRLAAVSPASIVS
ncbi:MAG: hypothetical protein WAM53_01620 [Terrimicrobiaceae bacterium]